MRVDPYWIAVATSTVIQLAIFLRWMHRKMRDDEINRAFVRDMATNHLPHLYHAMRQLAQAQGIELEEPPVVQWVEINGKGKR